MAFVLPGQKKQTFNGVARKTAPGPKGVPFLGVLPEFVRNPTGLLTRAMLQYGDIARLEFGPYNSYLVIHPDLVRYVLQENIQNFCRGKVYERFKIFFGTGLLTLEGETWLYHRRVTQPHFHLANLNKLIGKMDECTEDMLNRWDKFAEEGTPVDLETEMLRLSLRLLGKAFLDTDLNDRVFDELRPSLKTVLDVTTQQMYAAPLIDMIPRQIPLPRRPRTIRTHRQFKKLVYGMIERHRKGQAEPNDYIDTLLEARDRKTGEALTDLQIYDEIMTLILAGYETVGNGAAWTLYALSKHPEVRRRLEQELKEVLDGKTPAVEDLGVLPYLQMVIDESLRLYPPIWAFPRDSINDDVIGGYHIPAGSMILLSPYATHHSPAIWDDPEAFDPERFAPQKKDSWSRFAYFPFGGGQRQCIGNRYALMQMQVVVSKVVQRFQMHLIPGHKVEFSTLNTLHPKDGIWVTLHKR